MILNLTPRHRQLPTSKLLLSLRTKPIAARLRSIRARDAAQTCRPAIPKWVGATKTEGSRCGVIALYDWSGGKTNGDDQISNPFGLWKTISSLVARCINGLATVWWI